MLVGVDNFGVYFFTIEYYVFVHRFTAMYKQNINILNGIK